MYGYTYMCIEVLEIRANTWCGDHQTTLFTLDLFLGVECSKSMGSLTSQMLLLDEFSVLRPAGLKRTNTFCNTRYMKLPTCRKLFRGSTEEIQ